VINYSHVLHHFHLGCHYHPGHPAHHLVTTCSCPFRGVSEAHRAAQKLHVLGVSSRAVGEGPATTHPPPAAAQESLATDARLQPVHHGNTCIMSAHAEADEALMASAVRWAHSGTACAVLCQAWSQQSPCHCGGCHTQPRQLNLTGMYQASSVCTRHVHASHSHASQQRHNTQEAISHGQMGSRDQSSSSRGTFCPATPTSPQQSAHSHLPPLQLEQLPRRCMYDCQSHASQHSSHSQTSISLIPSGPQTEQFSAPPGCSNRTAGTQAKQHSARTAYTGAGITACASRRCSSWQVRALSKGLGWAARVWAGRLETLIKMLLRWRQ
jgi:hypothetical protein